jgi:hypothetical protein
VCDNFEVLAQIYWRQLLDSRLWNKRLLCTVGFRHVSTRLEDMVLACRCSTQAVRSSICTVVLMWARWGLLTDTSNGKVICIKGIILWYECSVCSRVYRRLWPDSLTGIQFLHESTILEPLVTRWYTYTTLPNTSVTPGSSSWEECSLEISVRKKTFSPRLVLYSYSLICLLLVEQRT